MSKTENKPMPKWLIYTLFILKTLLGLALIYWTVYKTFTANVGADNDNAFLSSYHKIDENYNKMIKENQEFAKKYNIKFVFNDKEILGLSQEDVFLSQRAINKRKTRKNMVNVGKNIFEVYIQDKDGKPISTKTINMLITKNTTHKEDVKLLFKNEDKKEFEIKSIGYWNITGTVEVGDLKGYFYIKTNTKQHRD